ncbi:hypothetical protein A6R68_00377, partial [Neotoma lepida]
MSPPQLNRRKMQQHKSSTTNYNFIRRNLRIHILYSNWIPRTSRNHWIYFPHGMSSTTNKIPLYIQTPLRIRSSSIILTLCRRTLIFRSHLISTLLCLEGIILTLFIITTITSLNTHSIIMYPIPIVILVFAACEAAIGLALLVKVSNSYASQNHMKKETELNKKTYISIIVSLQILIIITFSSNELIIFYILFEATLIPTLVIITRWGNQTERLNAVLYFLFYTLIGSIPLLIALTYIQNLTGSLNFLLFPLNTMTLETT